jgi:uncharacterized phage protein (TIGR02218 family)
MRSLPVGLKAHLESGVTTLCHCWRLDLASGEAMGFTDHDRDLNFDGLAYEAEAGVSASEIESALGLAVDNLEASGALTSARISEARIAAGDFDNAGVRLWRVNWQDVSQRVLLRRGYLGEVTRGPNAFTAELRGLAHVLNAPHGRIFQFGCDAVLGDARCCIDLTRPQYSAEAIVLASGGRRRMTLQGLQGFAPGFFARGTLRLAGGRLGQIKFHRVEADGHLIELWQPLAEEVPPGARVSVTAGCDKQFATCARVFGNARNFRGFPHMPGDDFVMASAAGGK